jgi:aminoglycoside phosphotransferase (APT) family kinase protein
VDTRLRERLAAGRTAEVYDWGEARVLKLFLPWCGKGWAREEAEVVAAIRALGLPVPAVYELVEVDGRSGIVYERVEGRSQLETALSRPWRLRSIAQQFAEIHARMHGLAGDGLRPLRPAVARAVSSAPARPAELRERLLRALDGLPDGESLCHLDFHPDQVILSARGPVVIDWLTARAGDPLADVARTIVMLTVGHVPTGGPLRRGAVSLWRRSFRRSYLARYRSLRPGMDPERLRLWLSLMAAARLEERIEGEEQALLGLAQDSLDRP